jgi:hypothetical protein
MAVDNLYNIFYPTDPVAYAINPAVDVRVAKERPPLDIPNVTPSMFPSLPNMPSMPAITMPNVTKYMPSWGSKPPPAPEEENAVPPQNAVEMELKGGEMCLMGTRGERRFAALNPRGALDFALPSTGVNDYLDMITAHGNYWNDPNFGAFVLNETFATAEDEARTGPSIERLPIPGSWEGDE